jgi:hypothetical protein
MFSYVYFLLWMPLGLYLLLIYLKKFTLLLFRNFRFISAPISSLNDFFLPLYFSFFAQFSASGKCAVTQNAKRVVNYNHRAIEAHPGVDKAHPEVKEVHPGVKEAHPGVKEVHCGVKEDHPGAREAHPGVKEGHPVVKEAHVVID